MKCLGSGAYPGGIGGLSPQVNKGTQKKEKKRKERKGKEKEEKGKKKEKDKQHDK